MDGWGYSNYYVTWRVGAEMQRKRWSGHQVEDKGESERESSNLNTKFPVWKSGRILATSVQTGKSTAGASRGARQP